MSENLNSSNKTPGIVIFTAILNIFSCVAWLMGCLIAVVLLVAGNTGAFYEKVTSQMQQSFPGQTLPVALTWNVIFAVLLVGTLFFFLYHLILAIGLLKAKGVAWYFQVTTAVIGFLIISFGTILGLEKYEYKLQ